MNLEIRKPKIEDAESIIEHKIKVTKENPDTLATAIENQEPDLEDQINKIKNIGENDLKLVALDGDTVIGIINMFHDKRHKFRHIAQFGISVQHKYAGHGIGSKLIEEVVQFSKENEHIEKLILTVFGNNDGAIRLYERFGFEREATLKDQVKLNNDSYTDLIYMSKWVK